MPNILIKEGHTNTNDGVTTILNSECFQERTLGFSLNVRKTAIVIQTNLKETEINIAFNYFIMSDGKLYEDSLMNKI